MRENAAKRLLIIDDDVDVVNGVQTIMEGAGWEVHSAPDGASGVQRAREIGPDLIILDILMPQRDGLTTYEDLRRDATTALIPVIVMTSVSEKLGFSLTRDDMTVHYGRGPEAFLEKPVDPKTLLATVESVTAGQG
ncbi:MAG: response regulator [Spirochaetales bacterium]|nr:response regulator [Spirochaetales bacterium]